MYDYDIQRGPFEEDLELLSIGKPGYLTLMLGDFNHKLNPNSIDKLYKVLPVVAQIPNSTFPKVECSAHDLSLVRTLGSQGMFCLNGRMKKDRLAKPIFQIGNQTCPIDYAFVNAWSFGEMQDFEIEHIEGSDHWPLQLTIRSTDKNQREKAVIALVEYLRRITTPLTESSLGALNELIVNYPNLPLEKDPRNVFKGYSRGIALIVDCLKTKLKKQQVGKIKGEPYKINNSKVWFNWEFRCKKQKIRTLEREFRKRPTMDTEVQLCQAKQSYKTLIRQKKQEYIDKNWDTMIEVIRTKNIRGFWQLVREGKVSGTMRCLVGEEDSYKYLSTVYNGIDIEEGHGVIRKMGENMRLAFAMEYA
ncbi:hypothetical protein NDU88_004254 [Pleurodeles waltl]|uniref:Endonuclease/exonuclease/phosphatase domain-containing protein n=1 Tax=Pleurodeles waltl TaxID=8319 RepID=A0AAV7VJQ3_PLEWA|nr:hypothetical protein NDU88_004254 [Pleurodeles waltl]